MRSFRVQIRLSLILLVTVILLTSDVVIYAGLHSLLKSGYLSVGPPSRLQSDGSISLGERPVETLMWLMVITTMAMIIVSWFAGDWLARKMLKTIQELSRTAEGVSGSSLDARGNLEAPYSEFQQLADAFNSMSDQLHKAYETERRFVDYAAHQMQTPLTVLRGNVEVALQKERSSEEYREVLVSNLNQVERLIRLTKSLLTLARFTSGRPSMHLAPVRLEPLLRELIDDLALVATDRKIRLTLEAEPVPVVLGNELGLKQLFINLLDNALRHTDPGGMITVRLWSSVEVITVTVQDNGHGIDPKHVPYLFDRFYRADSGTGNKSGGTGLGLPIVKEITIAHHGTITVESEVGKGSTFTLTLHAMKLLNPQVMSR
jgi:signal transduction histidine kinase